MRAAFFSQAGWWSSAKPRDFLPLRQTVKRRITLQGDSARVSFMSEREHTSKQFEQQLRTVKDKLLLMSHHAEKMIADSIRALVDRRPSLAEEVIRDDDTLDQLELEVDNLCYQILALEQPVARDLRFITT